MKRVALIGYSGHALVVADTLQQTGYEIIGYFEKDFLNINPLQLNYLGFEEDVDFINKAKDLFLFPAIGDNNIRKKIINLLTENKLLIVTAIHPKANVSKYSEIKEGTLICQGACVNPFARIGIGVIINTAAIIEHECVINDYAHIAPGAVLAGNVLIGENSFIGANAVIKQGVKIGRNVIIGTGSVVLYDVPDNNIYVGNPARRILK